MGQNKIPIWLRLLFRRRNISVLLHWKRMLSSVLLGVFCFQLWAPSALAYFAFVDVAKAEVFGGSVAAAVSSVFGKTGEVLQKFSTKSEAINYQASAANKTQFDLVAILVDEEIANNSGQYQGLANSHNPSVPNTPDQAYRKLTDQTLMGRIERYAKDIQGINKVIDPQPFRKTVIIKVKRDEPTDNIASSLEKLYREGDGATNETNHLKGIVIVGEVPLPVVNKNDNRFVSLFPYTDFEDPYYIYDAQSKDFRINPANRKQGAEVWHGVIVPPADGEDGNKLLAEYFDKNHLYKIGEPEYKDFDKKLFYSDMNKEYQLLGAEGLPAYYQYLKYWEDISYFRFNKNWAKKLYNESSGAGQDQGDKIDNDGDGKIDEDPVNGYDDDGDGEDGSPLFGLNNGVDDDGDGVIDNDEEGVWGFCHPVPATGKTHLENCKTPGKPYKTGDFYNTVPGSIYKIKDGINNNPETNQLIDEGIGEDPGDATIGIDNDRDGRIDEDTSADNDADGDKRADEDGPGDSNGDGCPGDCGVDENNDSIDGDGDGWPDGYEKEYGSLILTPLEVGDLIDAVANGNSKKVFASKKISTDPKDPFSFPIIVMLIPPLPPIIFPRFLPWPDPEEWVDNSVAADDDEDGLVDEDGTADNDNDQDGSFDEDPGDALGTNAKGDGSGIFDNLPDIRSKDIILAFFKNYNELFDRFYADLNTWTGYTGRWDPSYKAADGSSKTDLVSFPYLIAAKDGFTMVYLKAVNDAIERKVDDYVQKLQYDIRMVRGATLSGYVVLPDDNGVFPVDSHITFNSINFINFGYRNDGFFAGIGPLLVALIDVLPAIADGMKKDFLDAIKGPVSISTPIYINGKPIESINNIQQCSLYRGSEGVENSQMVIGNSVYDPASNQNTELPPQMPKEWNLLPKDALIGVDGNDYHGLFWWWNNHKDSPMVKWLKKQKTLNASFAGCFSENTIHPERCYAGLATRYIFSLGGAKQVTGIPESAVSHQACFDLKEKNGYDAFSLDAAIYLSATGDNQTEEAKKKFESIRPDQASAYRAPRDIKLMDFFDNRPKFYEITPGVTNVITSVMTQAAQVSPKLTGFSINFEDVLKSYMAGNRVDDNGNGIVDEAAEANIQFFPINSSNHQPNWLQVGEQLLQTARTNESASDPKAKPLKFGNTIIPGTKEVSIKVTPIFGQTISSLVLHKEPTIDTLEAQTYELKRDAQGNFIVDSTLTDKEKRTLGQYETVTKTAPDGSIVKNETRYTLSMPIDSPRYASFRDWQGNYQKIVYPNAFKAKDAADLKQQLANLENQLKAIQVNPVYAGLGPSTVDGYLTGVIEPSLKNDVINTTLDAISVVAEKKLDDALQWRDMDIDQKHEYSVDKYWGSAYTPYTPLSESKNGYEVLYLNSAGQADALSMKFNKDIPPKPPEPKVEKVDCSKEKYWTYAACKNTAPSTPPPGGSGSSTQADEDNSVIIFAWFGELKKWAEETADIVNGKGSVTSCPVGGFTDIPDDPGADQPYQPQVMIKMPIDLDGNGVPDDSDKTVSLSIALENKGKTVLKAGTGDLVNVIVQALDKDGKLNNVENNNQVKLNIKNVSGTGEIATVVGQDTLTFASGKATFPVTGGDVGGTVALQAQLVKKPTIKSGSIALTVSLEAIKLIAYRRYNSYQFTQGAAAGYLIFDGNGKAIAEVDPQSGYINILNDKYELGVLPANGFKPLRQTVVSKEDGTVMAILYFVVGGDQAITIDAPGIDYAKSYQELSGVHIKDLSASDTISLQTISDDPAMKGNVLLVDSKVSENKGRVGLLDKKGNLFTSLKMQVKAGPNNGPVVFVVDGDNGGPAFELYLGAKFEMVKVLPYEQIKGFFASLPGALLLKQIAETHSGWVSLANLTKLKTVHAAPAPEAAATTSPAEAGTTSIGIPDTDQDGLNDLEEIIIGTKVDNPDTNGDGITDLDSLNQGIDPRVAGSKPLFSDIKPGDAGFIEIVKLFRRGIFVADQNGQVRPKDNITREEFIKLDLGGICIICDRFAESVKTSVWKVYAQNPFPDLDIGNDYKYCVAEGKNRGIISGYKAFQNIGYYVPKANISRAEATKVILETARQQVESFPDFVVDENLTGKPWYYNYVLTAQKEGIYPKGKFLALDSLSPDQFQTYFGNEIVQANSGLPGGISNSQFLLWMEQLITRGEFAIMVSRFVDKYNCQNNDSDGDGIPDNFEKYIYGTNPNDADTDHGGVNDGVEILRGSDPLDPSDDFPKAPGPDLNADPDDDGLITGKEMAIGTDPFNPDTDGGGVKDGLEVLIGIDPLDQGDDKDYGKGSGLEEKDSSGAAVDGAYVSGIEIGPKTIYNLPDDNAIDQSQINTEETDRVPADGESILYIKASLYDAEGNLRNTDNSSVVRFGFKNPDDDDFATLNPLNVKVKGGQAETTLTAKTKTGLPVIIASVDGELIPTDEQLIEVYALEPATATLEAVSPIIPSGGKSATALKAIFRDKNGNLANSGNYKATFTVEALGDGQAQAVLDNSQDELKDKDGLQMSSVTGEYNLSLKSGLDPEKVKVKVIYQGDTAEINDNINDLTAQLLNLGAQIFKPAEVSGEADVETRNDLLIYLKANKPELKSDGQDLVSVQAKVTDGQGKTLDGFKGKINLKLLNAKMGSLIGPDGTEQSSITMPLAAGEVAFKVKSSLKAGEVKVLASVEGLPMATLNLLSYAYAPTQIVLESKDLEIDADPGQVYTATAKLYDNAGNFVNRDNATQLSFSIDPETAKFGSLISAPVINVTNGEASVSYKTGTLTGPIRLRVKSKDLLDGTLEVNAVHRFNGKEFRDMKPKFLYGNLLGAAYGEVTKNDYFGGWFIFSGKVESAASLITDPKPKLRLAEVLTTGKINLTGDGDLEIKLIPTGAENGFVKQLVTDNEVEKDVLEVTMIPKPQSQAKVVNSLEEADRSAETVNVVNLDPGNEKYSFDNDGEAVTILRDGQLIANIGRDAKIKLLSPLADIAADDEDVSSEIAWTISDSGNQIATIVISAGDLGDVQLLDEKTPVPSTPGIYLRRLSTLPARSFVQSFSGNSTAASRGYYYTDDSKELDKSKAPGLAYLSLESADTENGVGLRGENKNILLFSGGNSVGEANLPYASDAGVVLGDPTVRLDNKTDPTSGEKFYSGTGFTKDLGKLIYAGDKPIKDISTIDYDNDGDKDLLISYENGEIRLIENINKGKEYRDRGMFLNFPTGILSATVMDINDDGWEDLIVATADSCKVGEVCVDAYLNDHSNFTRKNLGLLGYTAKNKVYMIKSADMNQDSYPDLVVSDDTGTIKVFYTKFGQIEKQGQIVGNLGVKINQTNNLKEEVFAFYDGMAGKPIGSDNKDYEEIVLRGKNSSEDKKLTFKSLAADANLGVSSVKNAKDMTEPFNVLAEGDQLEYTIKLVNSGNNALKNLIIGDIAPETVDLDRSSIKCIDCKDPISLIETGQSLRPYLIVGIDLPGKTSRTITYNVRVSKLPKVKIVIGQNLSPDYPVKDGYPDIAATPDDNPTGKVVYFYSVNKDNVTNRINYAQFVTPDPNIGLTKGYTQPKDNVGNPVGLDLDLFEQKGSDGIPVAVKHYMDYGSFPGLSLSDVVGGATTSTDSSGDTISELPGIGAAYDGLSAGLDDVAGALDSAIGALTCSGGCIPMPINYAFLAPGPINVMGIPSGFDFGVPIFAWGVPAIVPIWPPFPYQTSVGGRIYVAPTLTAKVAMSVCLGPYLIGFGPVPGNCFTFVIPIDPLAGLCDAIAGAIEGTLSNAQTAITDGANSIGLSTDGSLASTPTQDGKNYTGGFESADSLGSYGFKVNAHTNIRIPSFPSVLTTWLDNQTTEIIDKLTDLPDLYILLPDIISPFKPTPKVKSQTVSPKGLRWVLTEINRIPIISIEPKEVLIMVPSLTPGEIDRFINDAKQWVEDEKAEVQRILGIWRCGPFKETVPDPNGGTDADGKPKTVVGYVDSDGTVVYGTRPYNTICDMFTADMSKLIESVEKNIDVLNSYKEFPRQVLAWRNYLTKYVTQIICYVDAIVQFFIGNLAKWLDQATGWVDAVATIVETIATWKLLLDLVIDYQASCDMCTSSRFSLLELILKLFMFIPSPPIIPFPKLPDIYLDFSQIQFGIKILFPDIKFRPLPIVLPKLPRLVLPDLPLFKITLPAIPILPELPTLPELPDLPPLTLPALPNLPPPPKIPELPGAIQATISILKKIFLILCLIKKGFIPTSEMVLKTTIEHMTERGLDPLLPFDLGLALQWPEISYNFVERVVVTLKVNLHPDFSVVYDVVQNAANKLNSLTTNFTDAANAFTNAVQAVADSTADKVNNAPEGLLNYLPKTNQINPTMAPVDPHASIADILNNNPAIAREFRAINPQLADQIGALATVSKELEVTRQKFIAMEEKDFQDIHLIAGTITIRPTDPLANRPIEELENFDLNNALATLGPEFQETKKLVGLRQNLLAYLQESKAIDNQARGTTDLSKFASLMAKAPTVGDVLIKSGYSSSGTMYAQGTMLADQKKLYAANPSLNDIVNSSGLPPNMQNKTVAKGMFIYNQALKQNEKLIAYEDELSLPTTMNFVDADKDSDKDLIYSFGSNIYFKQNYQKTANIGKFYGALPKYYNLEDLVPAGPSVSGFGSSFSGNKTLDLKWNKASSPKLTGYEVIIGKRLGGVSYKGVINDLNGDGLQKYVYLNDIASTGSISTNSVLQPAADSYDFPASQLYELVASAITGEVDFDGPKQQIIPAGSNRIKVVGGIQIYASQDTVLKVWLDGIQKADKKMAAHELITMSKNFGADLEIQVSSGAITLITADQIVENQKLVEGSKVELNTKYRSVNQGSALIKLPKNAYTRVDAGQSMEIQVLSNPDQPATTLQLDNGFYYAVIRSFDQTGFRSLISESTLLWPNICSDRQEPMPVAGPSEREVAIFKALSIDASKSFDTFGKVVSYYIDTDLETDSDGDGDKTNDKNLGHDLNSAVDSDGDGITYNDLDDPKLFVGPYKDLNDREVMLNVVDESGNTGKQKITIHIYVPAITLEESSTNLKIAKNGDGGTVSGSLDPAESNEPISLLRDRDGVKSSIVTRSADSNGKYYSDDQGNFSVNDLNLKDTVIIKNAKGEIVAEIDPKTGRIILKDPSYSIEALPAEEPVLPTRVVVKDPGGQIITTLFIVSDANTDVTVDGPEVPYTQTSVPLFKGVHLKNLLSGAEATDFEIKTIPGDAAKFAGGVEMIEKSTLKRVMVLDPGGNFYIYDPRIKLLLKSTADLKEPMIFQVMLQNADSSVKEIAEFYVSFSSKNPISILDPNQFKLFVGAPNLHGPKFDTDKDGMPDIWEMQYALDYNDPTDAKEDPDKDGLTNLDEYRAGTNPLIADTDGDGYPDGLEKILGKDPTTKLVSPFADVDENNPYYESILNFYARGILAGIPAGNQLKFGFDQPINRAEYAKVMLDTFCIVPRPEAYLAPGVFTDIPYLAGQLPWYYPATKEAYFQGFITGYKGQIDKLTGRTPFAPEATITKAEAVKIILEALEREGVISLAKLPLTEPYYLPYMAMAQNLEPYVVKGMTIQNNYILTAEEAADPEGNLNRGEFIKLADRVLTAYDCSLFDTDGDGMPDFWENRNRLKYLDPSDADLDPDGDRLTNLQEYKYGTDPHNPDTDGGGVPDGVEVLDRQTNPLDPKDDYLDTDGDGLSDYDEINKYKTDPNLYDTDGGGVSDGEEVLKNGTNPLNPLDDKDSDGDGLGDKEETDIYKTDPYNPDTDGGGIDDGVEVYRGTDPLDPADDLIDPRKDLGPGVYVIPAPCTSCPCPSAIDHTADLIAGDKILAVISNKDNSQIFSQSNLVQIVVVEEKAE